MNVDVVTDFAIVSGKGERKTYICNQIFKIMRAIFASMLVVACMAANAQPDKWSSKKYFTVMSYNVENLFDTLNTNGKNDEEFTPAGKKEWTSERYQTKLSHLAEVIAALNPEKGQYPDIVAIEEAENISVLRDLAAQKAISEVGYQCILEEGPDPRGIDCGLLYNSKTFKYISHRAIQVKLRPSGQTTRDILYVKGMVDKETLHIFVNHWPSRVSGKEKTENKRAQCADRLKEITDSIIKAEPQCNILIMGDMNDEPDDESVLNILQAKSTTQYSKLNNIMYLLQQKNKGKFGSGTYYYKGEYSMLDNLIVSNPLLTRTKGFRLYERTGYIFAPDFISFKESNGDIAPSRSYSGKYYGGYSDHYPVYMIFYKK